MFVAMNHFSVVPGQEVAFEEQWRSRESYLDQVPGFLQFALLRGDADGEYISHTIWRDRAAFLAWTESDAFRNAHRQAGVGGIIQGPPQLKLFEAVLVHDGNGPQ